MYGWTGKFLRVDLTKSKIKVEDTDPKIAKDFIGGRGMGAKYLYDEIDPKVDPLSPANKLLFVTGPLTGTMAPAGNRYVVVTKAPLTDALANSSCAAMFSWSLKYAGYDMIIFEGKSKKPVYLWIDDDNVELRDAQHLWGETTSETETAIIAETAPEAKVACIGPAGEKQVLFACVISDGGRAAGRSGVGAVMGSKNLKAVAARGTKGLKVADNVAFYNAVTDAYKALVPEFVDEFHHGGTAEICLLPGELGITPVHNYSKGFFKDYEKLVGPALTETLAVKKGSFAACPGCPIGCGPITRVTDPEFAGFGLGPEYETIGSLGSNCGVSNLGAICKAGHICNEMGMDTISCGATIATTMELYEKGYLPKKDVGMALNFGDAHAVVEMTEKIGLREGFGNILAEGSYRVCEKYGHPELFMGTKKQEFPNYDPRALQGVSIHCATCARGGDHIRGEMQDLEIWDLVDSFKLTKDRNIKHIDPYSTEDKPLLTKDIEDYFSMIDSCGMCNFNHISGIDEDRTLALLEAATGIDFGGYKGFMKTGERITNQERLFILKAGFTAKDDTLPKRMLEEPVPDGPQKGQISHLNETLPKYYKLRGWDSSGVPTQEKLKELGLA